MRIPEKMQQSPDNQDLMSRKPQLVEYIDEAKGAFARVWNNKWLWFWGIFLPMGAGFGTNMNLGGTHSEENRQANVNGGDFFATAEKFVQGYFIWIILAIILVISLSILFWIISAVARSGVIQAIHQMQQPNKALTFGFKDVWRKGKKDALKIIKIDIYVFLALFLLLLVISLPIIGLVIGENYIGAILIGILALLLFIPASILAGYLKQTGVIIAVLSGENAKRSIEMGYSFVSKNIIEALKLFLVNFVLGLIHGFVIMGVMIVVAVVGSIIGAFLVIAAGGFNDIINNIKDNIVIFVVAITVAILLIIAFILATFVAKAFFSLWHQDIWLWWTKRLGGIIEAGNAVQEKEDILKREAAPGVNISSRK